MLISKQKPRLGAEVLDDQSDDYLIFASLYMTCLRATGSYFFISSLSGMVRLFLSVGKSGQCRPLSSF